MLRPATLTPASHRHRTGPRAVVALLATSVLGAATLSSCGPGVDPDLLEPPAKTTTGALVALISVDLDIEPVQARALTTAEIASTDEGLSANGTASGISPDTGSEAQGVDLTFTEYDGPAGHVRLTITTPTPAHSTDSRPATVACTAAKMREVTGCRELVDDDGQPGIIWWDAASGDDPGRIVTAQHRYAGTLAEAAYTGRPVPTVLPDTGADTAASAELVNSGPGIQSIAGGLVWLTADQRVDFLTDAYMARSGGDVPSTVLRE